MSRTKSLWGSSFHSTRFSRTVSPNGGQISTEGRNYKGSCPDRHQIATEWRIMRMILRTNPSGWISHQGWNQVYPIGVWCNTCLFCRIVTRKGSMMINTSRQQMRIRKTNASRIGWGFQDEDFQGRRCGLDQSWRGLHLDHEQMKESNLKKWTQGISHQEIQNYNIKERQGRK